MNPVTLALVEDNLPLADELRELFEAEADITVTMIYPTAETALEGLKRTVPDLLIVDLRLPGMSGVELIGTLKQSMPSVLIMVLTMYEESDLIFDALKAGAAGYLLKRSRPEDLCEAVRQVVRGGSPMSPSIARKVVESFQAPPSAPESEGVAKLSPREREILDLLAEGALYKEIADKLGISLDTVRTHLRRTYEKLHVHSRTQAVRKYLDGRR